MRYISDREHELLKCVGTLLAKQERKFKGKRVTILGYDESKRAIILMPFHNKLLNSDIVRIYTISPSQVLRIIARFDSS